jgi:5S rRNA maturation endonuclease (ribonuclease M5)
MGTLRDFVLNELRAVKSKKVSSKNVVICCPWHRERTPSFSINIDETNRKVPIGFGHCFSGKCGVNKNWNEIAEMLSLNKIKGMKKDGSVKQEYVVALNENMKRQLLGSDSLSLADIENSLGCILSQRIEKEDEWRGFSGKLLRKIGCMVTVDNYDNKCLILPVVIDGEVVGAQKGLWEKSPSKKVPSYFNMPGEWILHKGLFPYHYVEKMLRKTGKKYVVLVEGSRDALRLISKGVPALAILGTKNWSREKRTLIMALAISKVVIMMDGDDAGIEASNAIMKDLKGKLPRHLIKLKKVQEKIEKKKGSKLGFNIDPGNCPSETLKKIIEEIENVS